MMSDVPVATVGACGIGASRDASVSFETMVRVAAADLFRIAHMSRQTFRTSRIDGTRMTLVLEDHPANVMRRCYTGDMSAPPVLFGTDVQYPLC